ncbi:MAG: hypothetical protein ACM3NO_10905, partial [Deltaproteobacteria bacterium]
MKRTKSGALVPVVVVFTICGLGIALVKVSAQTLRKTSPSARTSAAKTAAPDQFIEVSKPAGIHFTLTSGGAGKAYIIEAKGGGGIAWIDYNNDGFPDLFLVNGSTFEDWRTG